MTNKPREPGYWQLGNMIVEVFYTSHGNLAYWTFGDTAIYDISYIAKGLEWGKKIELETE